MNVQWGISLLLVTMDAIYAIFLIVIVAVVIIFVKNVNQLTVQITFQQKMEANAFSAI